MKGWTSVIWGCECEKHTYNDNIAAYDPNPEPCSHCGTGPLKRLQVWWYRDTKPTFTWPPCSVKPFRCQP